MHNKTYLYLPSNSSVIPTNPAIFTPIRFAVPYGSSLTYSTLFYSAAPPTASPQNLSSHGKNTNLSAILAPIFCILGVIGIAICFLYWQRRTKERDDTFLEPGLNNEHPIPDTRLPSREMGYRANSSEEAHYGSVKTLGGMFTLLFLLHMF